MNILVDRNIPFAEQVFSRFGNVSLCGGREIHRGLLADVEILLVRSVTKVNAELLEGTPIRFVGTATIGTDHIALDYLKERGITFADAAGSNATSVAEYIAASLMHLEHTYGWLFAGKTMGIVGVGNVGSRVAKKAAALGMRVLLNDPPRAEREGSEGFASLDEILDQSDVITLHTPLNRTGPHPTHHLLGAGQMARMQPEAWVFNTSRGSVLDNPAALEALRDGRIHGVVLDVWEGEPEPIPDLVDASTLGTPHIAGYSYDGKIAGTRMMADAVSRFLRAASDWDDSIGSDSLPGSRVVSGKGRKAIQKAVLGAYPIREDDARFRVINTLDGPERGAYFDRLRKEYPIRREFHTHTLSLVEPDAEVQAILGALGFSSAD